MRATRGRRRMMRLMQSMQPRKKVSGERELRQGGIQRPRTKVEATKRAVQEKMGAQEGVRTRSGLHSRCARDVTWRQRRPGGCVEGEGAGTRHEQQEGALRAPGEPSRSRLVPHVALPRLDWPVLPVRHMARPRDQRLWHLVYKLIEVVLCYHSHTNWSFICNKYLPTHSEDDHLPPSIDLAQVCLRAACSCNPSTRSMWCRNWICNTPYVPPLTYYTATTYLIPSQADQTKATYGKLKQPPLNPPAWLFGPVWTTLYAVMGYTAHRAWTTGASSFKPETVALAKVRTHHLTMRSIYIHYCTMLTSPSKEPPSTLSNSASISSGCLSSSDMESQSLPPPST